jgi:hypothetical protein
MRRGDWGFRRGDWPEWVFPVAAMLIPLLLMVWWTTNEFEKADYGATGISSTDLLALVASPIFFVPICFVLAIGCLQWLLRKAQRRVERQKQCAHGVRAGASGRCQTCRAEAARFREREEAQAQERERRKRISNEAMKMRTNEMERLSKEWLGFVASYFVMTPRQFEDAIAELFRRLGYKVNQTPFTKDGGKDAIAWKDGRKFLIECKRYEITTSVGRRDIQIFVAAIQDEKAESGFYVNTGVFTRDATSYAEQKGLTIYDRSRFPILVNEAYPEAVDHLNASVMCTECGSVISMPLEDSPTTGKCPNGHSVTGNLSKRALGIFPSAGAAIPKCDPQCGWLKEGVVPFGVARAIGAAQLNLSYERNGLESNWDVCPAEPLPNPTAQACVSL